MSKLENKVWMALIAVPIIIICLFIYLDSSAPSNAPERGVGEVHQHSPSYNGQDVSFLEPEDGIRDALARVCDHEADDNRAGVIVTNGSNEFRVWDDNGARSGCGRQDFNRNMDTHRTVERTDAGTLLYGELSIHY